MVDQLTTFGAALEELGLRYAVVDGDLVAGFRGRHGHYLLMVREIQRPSLVWLRYGLDVFVERDEDALLELCLAVNQKWWLFKVGRQPETGAVVADIEIPLRGVQLTVGDARHYLTIGGALVEDFLERLALVRWGGMGVTAALDAEVPCGGSRRSGPGRARSVAEQEAESIIRGLLEGGDAGSS